MNQINEGLNSLASIIQYAVSLMKIVELNLL
jgi:hypothetical protein